MTARSENEPLPSEIEPRTGIVTETTLYLGLILTGSGLLWGLEPVLAMWRPEPSPIPVPVSALMAALPGLVAALVVRMTGSQRQRAFWRSIYLTNRRIDTTGLAIAIAAPLGLAGLQLLLQALASPLPPLRVDVERVVLLAFAFVVFGGLEELGWSSLLYEHWAKRRYDLGVAFGVGVIWALWHVVPYLQMGKGPAWVVAQCVFTVGFRVGLVVLYDRFSAGLVNTTVAHACMNLAVFTFPDHGASYDPTFAAGIMIASLLAAAAMWSRSAGEKRRW